MQLSPHPSMPSQVIVGYRVPGGGPLGDPNGAERVLTGIVKGTFAAGGTQATPAAAQLPIFVQDIFFNIVRNSGFSEGAQLTRDDTVITPVAAWISTGPTITHLAADEVMRVSGAGRVMQPVACGWPLGGRTFALRVTARASAAVTVAGIRLETASGAAIFAAGRSLSTSFTTFTDVATWPLGVEESEALLVLEGAAGVTVDYDAVQLNEGGAVLPADGRDPVRFEHDLTIFKPRADVVILGAPVPPLPGPLGGDWEERVVIGATTLTARFEDGALTRLNSVALPATLPWSGATPITLGWQNRAAGGGTSATRQSYAGTNLASFDASTMELPQNFDNRFFNGALLAGADAPFAHIVAASVTVESRGEYDNGVGGTATATRTTTLHLPPAPQMTVTFRTGAAENAPETNSVVSMSLDTLVYDKGSAQFYAVWRGVWANLETVGLERVSSVAFA